MSKVLSAFMPIPWYPGLWSADNGALRCTALRLRDGSLCLYSPVPGLGDVARSSLASLGEVSYLLAPNHYHHKGLAAYAGVFPAAALICSDQARPRLEQQTGLAFGGLTALAAQLADNCALVTPDGLKTGEVWFAIKAARDLAWVVCDAFKGVSGQQDGLAAHVALLGTFPAFGIQHKQAYATWVAAQLRAGPPTTVLPCHGAIVHGDDVAAGIGSLLG